ncbi:uncharacterized protein LOC121024537 [Herpailurus yagouaroundi]|uniref:uncharacterized protein LOC121024537 n=1 Tax=Herpailurus yagouaroundi TaxID=1608482 RepID=UPI001AD70117|nr:uncharacterized protein LOC121024537 [Puma yagouaroundi]
MARTQLPRRARAPFEGRVWGSVGAARPGRGAQTGLRAGSLAPEGRSVQPLCPSRPCFPASSQRRWNPVEPRLLSVSAHLCVYCGGGGGARFRQSTPFPPDSGRLLEEHLPSRARTGDGASGGAPTEHPDPRPGRSCGAGYPSGCGTHLGPTPSRGCLAWLPGGDELASLPPEPSLAAFILEGFVYGQVYGTGADLEKGFSLKKSSCSWLPVRGSVGAPKRHSRTLTRGTPSIPGGVSLSLKKGSLLNPERPQNQDPERGPWGRLTIARPPCCSRHALGEKFFRFPCLAPVSSAS